MELTISKREEKINKLRREKKIPAVLYGAKKPAEKIYIDQAEYKTILRQLKQGQILTTVFDLKMESGTEKAIIKSIQYHPTTYDEIHIDFQRLQKEKPIKIKVPIRFKGASECIGVKQGGVLKQAIRAVKVVCSPENIPEEVFIDVSDIGLLKNKNLSHVEIPQNVKPLLSLDEVIAVVAKR